MKLIKGPSGQRGNSYIPVRKGAYNRFYTKCKDLVVRNEALVSMINVDDVDLLTMILCSGWKLCCIYMNSIVFRSDR